VINNLEFEDLISKLFESKEIDMIITREVDALIKLNDNNYTFDFDYDFDTNIFPRIIVTFLSLDNMNVRKLLSNDSGNIVIEKDNRRLLLRNVNKNDIDMIDYLEKSISNQRNNNDETTPVDSYVLCQILNNYFAHIKKKKDNDIIKEIYEKNKNIIDSDMDIYNVFKDLYNHESLYNTDEFNNCINKKNKDDNLKIVIDNERLKELEGELNMGKKKKRANNDFAKIINEPIEKTAEEEEIDVLKLGAVEQAKMLLELQKERDQIKKDAEEFAKTILEKQKERRQIIHAAEEQAKRIIALEKENEELKKLAEENARIILDKEIQENREILKDASEYAKIIYAKQEERKSLLKAAEEQARRILVLEKENEELRKLAEENAKNLFARENKYRNEIKLREMNSAVPVNESDLDKLYTLLNALTAVENIDFAINRPTVLQEVVNLETKIETYITTHNVVNKESKEDTSKIEMDEKQNSEDLIDVIRNAYAESHNYEREGRHSVLLVNPSDEKIRVTVYSVKDDSDDILTEVYFDKEYFEDKTIKEICDIYKSGAIIVASKTDNLPGDIQDYLVIDSQDNAIKFMGCEQNIIEKAKAYL
jgi:hypothetical protein